MNSQRHCHATITPVIDIQEVRSYLDSYLRIGAIPDSDRALNGLQVENSGAISKIAAAVDACQFSIDRSVEAQCDLLIVHHGLFWSGPEPLTGRHGRRVRSLVRGDLALYSAHLPLDCHPVVGNNPLLARALGLTDCVPFGDYRGFPIGIVGRLDSPLDALVERIREVVGGQPLAIAAGPRRASRVAVVSGAGSDLLSEARDAGVDTFVTGEGPHHTFFNAEEWGLNLIYAGHYATETLGVQALAAHLSERFNLSWTFVDHPTGL